MDIQMPGMDGIEAARRIRARWPSERDVSIVALTANATQEDHAECVAAGMDGFLAKPVAPRALAQALESCARARASCAADAGSAAAAAGVRGDEAAAGGGAAPLAPGRGAG